LADLAAKLGRPDQANLWLQAAAACGAARQESTLAGVPRK